MKFITKINRNYFGLTSVLFILVTAISYVVISAILFQDAKGKLAEKEVMIKNGVLKSGVLPELYPLYETKKINDSFAIKSKYKHIYLQDSLENELEPFIEYASIIKLNNATYRIKIRQSTVENEDLVLAIILPLLLLLILAFSFSYVINKRQVATIWAKFESNLNEIEHISLQSPNNLKLTLTNIEEFDSLNKVIDKLVKKLQADYTNLKEFAENASHELQTPLAVILMNLEEVMQADLQEAVYKKVYQSYQEIKKLTKLNKNLLLLSKIDNQQFIAVELVNLSELIMQKCDFFSSIIASKNIIVKTETNTPFMVNMNLFLANILINNLLSNAINHNVTNGEILIATNVNSFKISNTTNGKSLKLENLFKRFYKENNDLNSAGLGLAIVKRITDASELKLNVHQEKNKLLFTLLK